MNQGKLEVIKQEMERVNIGILGISELKWTGMVNLTQMTIISNYCGQESIRKNGVALIVNKESKMQYLGTTSETIELSRFISKTTIQYHSNPSLSPTVMPKNLKLNSSTKTSKIF